MSNLRHDLPHYAVFHSRNTSGVCPLCHCAEATTWKDLQFRMERAMQIVNENVEHEMSAAMSRMQGPASVRSTI